MKVVFDENVSPHLVELLAKCGAPGDIQHVRKAKWEGKPDADWMPVAIKSGFAIITADRNERTRELTSADLKSLGAKVVFLGSFWDHMKIWDKTKWLVRVWDQIHNGLEGMSDGACYVVRRNGKLTEV